MSVQIYCESTNDAAQIVSWADYQSRPTSGGSASWSPPPWTAGQSYNSPDLSTPLQQIVNRAGWNSGQHINFLFKYFSGTTRVVAAYEHLTLPPPTLFASWS